MRDISSRLGWFFGGIIKRVWDTTLEFVDLFRI